MGVTRGFQAYVPVRRRLFRCARHAGPPAPDSGRRTLAGAGGPAYGGVLKNRIEFEIVRADSALFFQLFSAVRAEELGMQDWQPELRATILRFQFTAQAHGYRERFPAADYRLILRGGRPIGWLIVDRSGPALHCVDIAVAPEERRKGAGTDALRALQEEAAARDQAVVLTVLRTNGGALALYCRLGFQVTSEDDLHATMEWRR